MDKIAVLIPCYNESRTIEKVVTDFRRALPEAVYMFLLGLYMASMLLKKIRWCKEAGPVKEAVRTGMIRIVLWGGAVFYLLYTLYRISFRENKRVLALSAAGIILIAAAFLFSRHMTDNTYTFVMDAFFCFMAFGKDYRRLLILYLGVRLGLIVMGVIGYAAGITVDFPVLKPDREDVLHSFGLSHPNTWGHIAFLILLVIWYLWLSGRPVLTALLFWSVTVLILAAFSCKTVAVILIPFPAAALLADSVQNRSGIPFIKTIRKKILKLLLVWSPLIAFAVSMLLCWQMDWVQKTFYETRLLSWAMRFVEGGYALRYNGEQYIREQIDSLLSQTQTGVEIPDRNICFLNFSSFLTDCKPGRNAANQTRQERYKLNPAETTQTYPGRLMASDHGREPAGFFRKEKLKTAWDFGSIW